MLRIKKLIGENKGFLLFVFGMLAFRAAIADWYEVPSGSMYPTLMVGDRVIADRLAYDVKLPLTDIVLTHLADPKRGDIVTFSSPEDGTRLVKRIIGVPGDVVEMRGEELIVNGARAVYAPVVGKVATRLTPHYAGRQVVLNENLLSSSRPIIVMPDRRALRSFGPVTVPPGQYLMLGDNRDNSRDSRYIGFVHRELITGQVKWVAYSLDTAHYYAPRFDRIGAGLTQ
jgi:signal peptidase I